MRDVEACVLYVQSLQWRLPDRTTQAARQKQVTEDQEPPQPPCPAPKMTE